MKFFLFVYLLFFSFYSPIFTQSIFSYFDQDLSETVLWKTLKDPLLREKLVAEMKKDAKKYTATLVKLYNSALSKLDKEDRELIIEIVSSARNKSGEDFLKSVVGNKVSPDRLYSYQKYLTDFKSDSNYIKSLLDDKQLRIYSLAYLSENGKKEDYEIFNKILQNESSPFEEKILALKATMNWAIESAKKEVYLYILQKGNEYLWVPSILLFDSIQSEEIMEELCRISKRAQNQITRMNAAHALSKYSDTRIIPYLIFSLKEEFLYEKLSGLDSFMLVVNYASGSLQKLFTNTQTKNDFDSKKNEIHLSLKKLTNTNLELNYAKWFEWGVLNGYSIDGINLIHFLFSGYPERRKLAINASITILSSNDSTEPAKLTEEKSDKEFLLFLASELLKKGYLKDEKY